MTVLGLAYLVIPSKEAKSESYSRDAYLAACIEGRR